MNAKTNAHTPEWILCDDPDDCTIRTNDENSELVCEFPYGIDGVSGDGEKYAHLIAAAPELLDALQAAHLALAGYLPAHRNAVTDAAIAQARAAIARATGESA